MKATILWFNRAKEYGEAKGELDERIHIFQDACTNYVPKQGDTVEVEYKRAKIQRGFVKPMDLYSYKVYYLSGRRD